MTTPTIAPTGNFLEELVVGLQFAVEVDVQAVPVVFVVGATSFGKD